MKNLRPALFVLTLALGTFFATGAMAQDGLGLRGTGQGGTTHSSAYYTGHKYSRADLITLGDFSEPPIIFEWQVSEVSQTPVGSRMDFVIILDADINTVLDSFKAKAEKNSPVATLDPKILPFESNRELIVSGRSRNATPARFSLTGAGARRFVIDVSAEGTKTKVVLQNATRNRVFSGVVPPRAPLTPKDANPIGFLWN